ncbi:MAG: AAA family ATPase [Methylococcales bacterium]|nr:AAA family ATPase [Methylococcales bacterium]MDD5754343.1 AAA family ATPase [Methylococcales bacterium]
MADNDIFSTSSYHDSFDNEGLEMLPLITKERTQKFDLLLHLIPNLKQHLIVSGASGIGKTLLLDMLYDLDSEVWQCCFVQGSAELSFETIEAQLTKTMLRNKYESLDSAFQSFQEQHKKIVLIIDDAGLLVSGLMTTLMDYAVGQPALKLIFSLTPEARNNHRKTDRALDLCYLLEIPTLSKRQCAYFLRHLAAKPRTYSATPIDEKLLDKIYRDTKGIPARIMADFTKLSREHKNDYTIWLMAFAGLVILAIAINQGLRYFKKEPVQDVPILPIEVVPTPVEQPEKAPIAPVESQIKTEQDIIIPEFQLEVEKGVVSAPVNSPVENISVEKTPDPSPIVEPEKIAEPTQSTQEAAVVNNEKIEAPAEIIPIPPAPPVVQPEIVTPTVVVPIAPVVSAPPVIVPAVTPTIAFPKVEPSKGMKIQPLPEKSTVQAIPLVAPEVKEVKIEPVKKIEIKPVEKPVEVKKVTPPKVEPVKKLEPKSTKEKVPKETKKEKVDVVIPPVTGRYTLQLITLSSSSAIENFKKKHPALNKNFRVVKSSNAGQERFALMYGGFAKPEDAAKARQSLPTELANAFPRKLNP